jgi:hypothetical protein
MLQVGATGKERDSEGKERFERKYPIFISNCHKLKV